MRNLKKILALVLALVMSLSLMATAGAADFSDKDQITDKYSTAIEVLNGLEVFQGYDNGATFKPQGDITRAEVAAIIYRIATGDVSDTQKDIYSSWGLFTDVADGSWYAGYVNYCANAGYIKGRGNKIFDPNGKVTGYEALAMILRAIGYDKNNEFSGSNWQVRTASIAKERHITDNITDTLLGQSATREVVAEILFQSILVPQVQFNTSTLSYSNRETSLGYDVLKLEEVTGVVVSNEYANLNGTSVLAAGKTGFDVKGTTRTLDYGTDLTDIGESRFAYIQNAKVLSIADSGKNKVFDNTTTGGDGVDISTTAKFKKVSDINQQDSTEFFTNFGFDGLYDSDYRIDFQIVFAAQTDKDAFDKYIGGEIDTIATNRKYDKILPEDAPAGYPLGGYRKVYNAGVPFTSDDLKVIEGIFGAGGQGYATTNISGQVWVNSSQVVDINNTWTLRPADAISYKTFKTNYVNEEEKSNWNTANDGEWVKIVDNDGDGKAEYAFKTTFTLDKVLGTYTEKGVEYNEFYALNITEDDGVDALYMNDVAVGDIVLHTTIDKQALIWKADIGTDSVKLVSHKDKTITTTGDVTYHQSGINNVTRLEDDVTMVDDNVEYNFYLDAFGRVRAYEPVDGIKYALLTEMYYANGQNDRFQINSDLRVEMYAGSASGKEYLVSNAAGSDFILDLNGSYSNWNALENTTYGKGIYAATNRTGSDNWKNNILQPATATLYGNINAAGAKRTQADIFPTATTNVARYVVEKDGDIRLMDAERYNLSDNSYSYDVLYVDLANNTVKAKQELYDLNGPVAYVDKDGKAAGFYSNTVRALSDTEFYIVSKDGVSYYKDYRNLPAITGTINAAYAVARSSERTINNVKNHYLVADVIVIEAPDFQVAHDDLLLVLGLQSWWTNDIQSMNSRMATYTNQDLLAISAKTGEVVRVIPNNRGWGDRYIGNGLYRVWGLDDVEDGVVSADSIQYVDLLDGTGTVANTYKLRAGIVEAVNDHAEGSSRYITVWTKGVGVKAGLQSVYANAYNWGVLEKNNNSRNVATPQLRVSETGNKRVMPGDQVVWIEGSNGASKFIVDLTYSTAVKRDENRQTPAWLTEMYNDVMTEQTSIRPAAATTIKVKAVDTAGKVVENAVMLFDENGVPMMSTASADGTRSFTIPAGGNTSRYFVTIDAAAKYKLVADKAVAYENGDEVTKNGNKYDVTVSKGTIVVTVAEDAANTAELKVYNNTAKDVNAGPDTTTTGTLPASIGVGDTLTLTSTGTPFQDKSVAVKVLVGFTEVAATVSASDANSFTITFNKAVDAKDMGDMYVIYTLTDAEKTISFDVPTDKKVEPAPQSLNSRLSNNNPQPLLNISLKSADGKTEYVAKTELRNNGTVMRFTFTVPSKAGTVLSVKVELNTAADLGGKNAVTFAWTSNGVAVNYTVTAEKPFEAKQNVDELTNIATASQTNPIAAEPTDKAPVELANVTINGKKVTLNGLTGNHTYTVGSDTNPITIFAQAGDATNTVSIQAGADAATEGTGSANCTYTIGADVEAVTITITVSETVANTSANANVVPEKKVYTITVKVNDPTAK